MESFRWNPVHFFPQELLGEAAALQNTFADFNHLRMAAKIPGRVRASEFPIIDVFSDDVFDASFLAAPRGVFLGAADRGHIGEPGNCGGSACKLLAIG